VKFKRRRSSLLPRLDWRALHAPLRPLTGDGFTRAGRRPRRFASIDERVRQRVPRVVLALLAVAEVAGLVALLAGHAWTVRRVEVSGNYRLTAAQVIDRAGLRRPGSVLMVDPVDVQRRLATLTWVRSSQVGVALPDHVSVQVEEWQPIATYRAGGGPAFYVSDQAVTLGAAAGGEPLLDILGPQQPEPRVGRQALDPRLLAAMVNIERGLPELIGQRVQSFTVDSCGNLTLSAGRGWKAQFGRVLTPEEFASLKDKVAALKALAVAGAVNYDNPRLQYVNVMNPAAAAVNDGTVKPVSVPTALPATARSSAARSVPIPAGLPAVCR
jgi:cell division septal protein FtsQ